MNVFNLHNNAVKQILKGEVERKRGSVNRSGYTASKRYHRASYKVLLCDMAGRLDEQGIRASPTQEVTGTWSFRVRSGKCDAGSPEHRAGPSLPQPQMRSRIQCHPVMSQDDVR